MQVPLIGILCSVLFLTGHLYVSAYPNDRVIAKMISDIHNDMTIILDFLKSPSWVGDQDPVEKAENFNEDIAQLQRLQLFQFQDSTQSCPPYFLHYMSSCYHFVNISLPWKTAERFCQALNSKAHLVAVETDAEQQFIVQYRNYNGAKWSNPYLWTGAQRVSGQWQWIGKTQHAEKALSKENGHIKCAYMNTQSTGQWDVWTCDGAHMNFVCEIEGINEIN